MKADLKFLGFLIFSSLWVWGNSQSYTIDDNKSATVLANYIVGKGIVVSNASLSCNIKANGIFTNTNINAAQSITIDSGILLSTGVVETKSADTGSNFTWSHNASTALSTTSYTDAEISLVAGSASVKKDLCFLMFDYVPEGDTAYVNYALGSEEYPDYNCSQFNDAFGIFSKLSTATTFTNYSKVPGTTIDVAINSVNDSTTQNGAPFTRCTAMGAGSPFKQYYVTNNIANHIVYDGFTTVLKAKIPVSPNLTHTMKIAIADIFDGKFDSGLFIEEGSLTSDPLLEITKVTGTSGAEDSILIEGCNAGKVKFERAGTVSALNMTVAFSGVANRPADYNPPATFTIPAGNGNYDYNVSAILDNLQEGTETARLIFTCAAISFVDTVDFVIKDFANGITVFNATNDTTVCNNSTLGLYSTISDTTFKIAWSAPSGTFSCSNCANTNYTATNSNIFSSQNVTYRISAVGCNSVDSIIVVNIQPVPVITMPSTSTLCNGDSVSLTPGVFPASSLYTYAWTPNTNITSTSTKNTKVFPTTNQTYTLQVSTSAGCTSSKSVTIDFVDIRREIDPITSTNTVCGQSNGTISITIRSPQVNPAYTYSINGGTSYSSNNNFIGLSANTYNVSIKNGKGCVFDTTIVISSGSSAPSFSTSKVNTTCGLKNGSGTITSVTGKSPFTYQWSQGTIIFSTDTFADTLAAGTYVVKVIDSSGCYHQSLVIIGNSSPVNTNATIKDEACSKSNGTITISPTSGSSPFTYQWKNSASTSSIRTGLSAGTYHYTITDNNGCIYEDSAVINNIPVPTKTISAQNASCGQTNGAITISVSGGGNPYTYNWSNGTTAGPTNSTSHTISNLIGGKYKVTVTDNNGCVIVDSATITSSSSVSVSISSVDAKCNKSDGSISLTTTSGTPPFTYSWSNGDTTQNVNNLSAGLYRVTVTDSNNCSITQIRVINTTIPPNISLSITNPKCNLSNGSIVTSVLSGNPPYSYLWSTSDTTKNLNNIGAGNFTITVTDTFGCTTALTGLLSMAPLLTFDTATTPTSCGLDNGSISLTNFAGATPYVLNWADISSSPTSRNNLTTGTYSVVITDKNNCTYNRSFYIDSSSSPVIDSVSIIDALCDDTTGDVELFIIDGTQPYTYIWSTGDTSKDLTNKTQGTYTVTVTDNVGCTATLISEINRRPSPTFDSLLHHPTCGIENGAIFITNVVSTTPLNYSWSTGSGNTGFINTLDSGTYTLTVSDNYGCTATDTYTLTTNGLFVVSDTTTVRPSCGDSNGSVTLEVEGGTPPYSIVWSNGDTGLIASNLFHGDYSAEITDSIGCYRFTYYRVHNQTNIGAIIDTTVSLCDSFTGTATITVDTGGTPPFTYIISGTDTLTSNYVDSLDAGIYTLRIVDSNDCIFDTVFEIGYISNPAFFQNTPLVTNATCDSNNGEILFGIEGATNPIQIYWDNTIDSVYSKTSLASGLYNIRVVDSFNCEVEEQVNVEVIPYVYPNKTIVPLSCVSDIGSITYATTTEVTATDVRKYTFQWSTGSTSPGINNLGPGTYTATITEYTQGCVRVVSDSLTYTDTPQLSFVHKRSNCNLPDGNLKVIAVTNYPTNDIHWYKNGVVYASNTDSIGGITAGEYVVKYINFTGCVVFDTFNMIDSPAATINLKVYNSKCTNNNGSIKAVPSITGAGVTYGFLWNNFVPLDTLSGLSAGTYSVTAIDNRGCTSTASSYVAWERSPSLSLNITPSYCNDSNGKLEPQITFGKAPFTYSWSNGDTTGTISKLPAGKYTLTLVDSNGCTATDSGTIISSTALDISIAKSDATCGLNNGSLTTTINSGTPPYTFNWDNTTSSLTINNLDSGKHVFYIVDSNLCEIRDTVRIEKFSSPSISFNLIHDNCTYGNGSITAQISGGKTPYTYSWNNGATTKDLINIKAGNYSLSVTDSFNCVSALPATIVDTPGPVVSILNNEGTCGNSNGTITINASSLSTPLSYFWNGTKDTTFKSGLNGAEFIVKVVDNRGCEAIDTVVMDTIFPLSVTNSFTNAYCNVPNGTIKINATGAKAPYTYTWGHSTLNTDTLSGLAQGTYYFTVSDVKNCTYSDSVSIIQSGTPVYSKSFSPSVCKVANGKAKVALASNDQGYTFSWSSGETTDSIVNKLAGTYNFTISDGGGCNIADAIVIPPIGIDSIELVPIHPKCGLPNGSIKANVYSPAGNITYSWSNGSVSDSIFDLAPGTYTVTISDSVSCTHIKSVIIQDQESPEIALTESKAFCGLNNGMIDAFIDKGLAPFSYNWDNGITAEDATNLDSGTYTLIVTDANLCKDTASVYVDRTPIIEYSYTTTKSICTQPNGEIQGTTTGGTGPYTYAWSSGHTTKDLINVLGKTYYVTISDNDNCSISDTIILGDFSKPKISSKSRDVVCGLANGSIKVIIAGGTGNISYLWNTGSTSDSIGGLNAGSYTVTVTDSMNCKDTSKIQVANGPPPDIYFDTLHSTCGLANGRLIASLPRGFEPIVYTWSTGVVNDTLDNLATGQYFCTASDARGCNIVGSVIITTTTVPQITLQKTDAYCLQPNGTITSTTILGTPPYSYAWSNGATTKDLTGVVPNTYKVILTDTVGCIDSATIIVNEEPNNLTATFRTTNLRCNNIPEGEIEINASGGATPYSYRIKSPNPSSYGPNSVIRNLSAGSSEFEVRDSKGCLFSNTFSLTEPSAITQTLVRKVDLKCNEEHEGEIEISTSGGTGTHTVNWEPSGKVGKVVKQLAADTHYSVVVDANGCLDTAAVILTQPTEIMVSGVITNNNCFGESNGNIDLTVSGATPGYNFNWSTGHTSEDISGLKGDKSYTVSITDGNGCVDTFPPYWLTDPQLLRLASVNTKDLTCSDLLKGEIEIIKAGGTGPFQYSIDNGQSYVNENIFKNLDSGKYIIYVKDRYGCTTFIDTSIKDFTALTVNAFPKDIAVKIGEEVKLSYTVASNGNKINNILWTPDNGLTCADCENPVATVYADKEYIIEVNFSDDCIARDTAKVRIIDDMELYIPNVFSPSHCKHDENCHFRLYSNNIYKSEIMIFNRWGEKVFESKEAHRKGWKGNYKGKNAPLGLYYYQAKVIYLNQRVEERKGTVTLIR